MGLVTSDEIGCGVGATPPDEGGWYSGQPEQKMINGLKDESPE